MATSLTITVVTPAYNAAADLRRCLAAIREGSVQPAELIVVDDGSTDDTPKVAQDFGAVVLSTGGRRGPGVARNLGAKHAQSDVVLFLDADVCVHSDTLERVQNAFRQDSSLDAVIGSYDHSPAAPGVLSQYRNLLHHYTHQHAARRATTFWSGCGAIRRELFLSVDGFDASYERPAIEDIELGYRLHERGAVLAIDPSIQVTHWKRWTMRSMVRTDVFDRGIPWTLLILRAGRMPDDLNVRWTQRLSILGVAALLLLTAVCAALYGGQFLAPAAAILLLATGSYWVIEAKHRESASVPLAITASIIALALMSWAIDRWEPLLLVSAGYLGLAAREWVGASHGPWKRPLGWLYGIYLVAGTAYLASMVPVTPMISLLAVTVVLVVTLNIRFYRFLCGRLGTLGGIAAVPLHLLYFLYSGLSFAAGSAVALKSRRASLGR